MEQPNNAPKKLEGFEGVLAGLGLADVIQMNGLNRFTGCITVEGDGRRGQVFFRDGQVVHASAGDRRGEEAFYEILQWPGGTFTQRAKVESSDRSIDRHWQYLLMEAHRLIDEGRRERTAEVKLPGSAAGPAPASRERLAQILEEIGRVPGVRSALILDNDGSRLSRDEKDADTLQGEAAYVLDIARRLGSALALGEPTGATVQGAKWSLLLRVTKAFQLTALVASGQVGTADRAIRALFSPQR